MKDLLALVGLGTLGLWGWKLLLVVVGAAKSERARRKEAQRAEAAADATRLRFYRASEHQVWVSIRGAQPEYSHAAEGVALFRWLDDITGPVIEVGE